MTWQSNYYVMFAVLYNANMHDYNQTGKKMKFFFFYSSDERQEQLIEVISRCFAILYISEVNKVCKTT